MRLTIRWKFILSIGLTLLVTYLGVLTWDYWWQKDRATQEVQDAVTQRAQGYASNINSNLEAVMQVAETVSTAIERKPPTSENNLDAIIQESARPPGGRQMQLWAIYEPAAEAGVEVTPLVAPTRFLSGGRGGGRRGGPDRGRGPQDFGRRGGPPESDRGGGPPQPDRRGVADTPIDEVRIRREYKQSPSYSIPATERRGVWTEPQPRSILNRQTVYSTPILIDEVFRGVVAVSPSPAEMLPGGFRGGGRRGGPPPATMPTTAPIDPERIERQFTVIDHVGRIITMGPEETERASLLDWAKQNGATQLADELHAALNEETEAVHLVRVKNVLNLLPGSDPNEYYWVALAPVSATGWVVAAGIPESLHLDPLIQHLWQRALFLAGGLVVLLMVTAFVSIRVSRPIEKMASAVNQLASGDLDTQVRGVHNRDEIGQLAGAFNTMTRQLKQHVAALTEQTAARQSVEAELRIARQIQTDLLPRRFPPFPDRNEFDLYAVNVPAKRVAGDFFDFFFAPNDLLTIAIADVAGKGMPAALLMAVTRTIIRNLAMEGMTPHQIIERANTMLVADSADSMFVTLFLCQYNTRTGEVKYVNAGHPRPYVVGPTGSPQPFGEVTGAILGVNPNGPDWLFEQREGQLNPGELLLLYTDGVTEARAPDGSMLRDAGLEDLISRHRNESVESICASFVEELNRFQNGQQSDDITLLALRRKA